LRQPSEHHEVGVKADALQAASAKRSQSVVVLQASELALNGNPAPVEIAEPLSVASDAGEQATEGKSPLRPLVAGAGIGRPCAT